MTLATEIQGAFADAKKPVVRRKPQPSFLTGPLPITLADARQSLELVTALYHSSATGTAVNLPIGTDHPKYNGWAPTSPA